MTPEGLTKLKDHEGLRLKMYTDSVGIPTIGYGRNLLDVGISYHEAQEMLRTDIARATAQARYSFDWFDRLDPVRQDVVVNLIFNLGIQGLMGFKLMLAAIERQDWPAAAYELFNSKWRMQVGPYRCSDLMRALETGEWDGLAKV
jgi:lysozyme